MLVIKIESEKGCVKFLGDLLYNAVTLPNDKREKKIKLQNSLDFIENTKAITMYCDCIGYDVKQFKKAMVKRLT